MSALVHETILPLVREVGHLRASGHYEQAAELEERLRAPITVAGIVLDHTGDEGWCWFGSRGADREVVHLSIEGDQWAVLLGARADGGVEAQTQGRGPTVAAALSDAHNTYQTEIADVLLRTGELLRKAVAA